MKFLLKMPTLSSISIFYALSKTRIASSKIYMKIFKGGDTILSS